MTNNDKIILDEVLAQKRSEIDPGASESDFFELFVAEQALKDYDLSYDEIEYGLVGSGGDGGVDSFHLFVNGELVQEDTDYSYLKKDITLDLVIAQAKTSASFNETPVERFITVSDDIFDLATKPASFSRTYNTKLLGVITGFRTIYQQLASRFPVLNVRYVYASKGNSPSEGVCRKVEKLKDTLQRYFPSACFSFDFLGASELLALARRVPKSTYTLPLAENPISSEGKVGFVCLVRLSDYYEFIKDPHDKLRREIFEANVRDYQGRTEVNDDIQLSLQESGQEDFWWLNNGITIISERASQSGKALTIEDPQIVNGLQTSTEIFNYCRKASHGSENRKVLVRVIVSTEDESRDRIIKATNSQTAVQLASLRATDKIHRDIEAFLKARGLYYDRRKNFYKNEGKPRSKIIGIPHMAQAVMSVLIRRPDTARARPSSLLKRDQDYKQVYNDSYPIKIYYNCIEIVRRTEDYLKQFVTDLSAKDRNNLRYYVAMHLAASACGRSNPNVNEVAGIDPSKITDADVGASLSVIRNVYTNLGATDQVAKGPRLLAEINGAP